MQRTVGGRVTPAVLRDVAYISYLTETKTPGGPWWELAVIHHTDCGSTLLADPETRRGFTARGGYTDAELAWLPATEPAATVRADVATLVNAPQLSSNIMVSGYVYNTAGRHCRHHRRTHPGGQAPPPTPAAPGTARGSSRQGTARASAFYSPARTLNLIAITCAALAGGGDSQRTAGAQSHRQGDARSPRRTAAWPHAGQPVPEEEIIWPAGTPQAGPRPPRRRRGGWA